MQLTPLLKEHGFDKKERAELTPLIMLYLHKGISQTDLRKVAKEKVPYDLGALLRSIPDHGEVLLDNKVEAYRYATGQPGVNLNAELRAAVDHPTVAKHLKTRFIDIGLPAYTVQQAAELEARAIVNREINTYAMKFLRRKLSFIVKSHPIQFEDLLNDVRERALYALRMSYPYWRSSGEMLAISKSAIKSAGLNLINFYAADKRQAIDGTNHAKTLSMDDTEGDAFTFTSLLFTDICMGAQPSMEAGIDIERLLLKCKQPNKRLFLSLLAGRQDDDFSEWLGYDNVDYAQRTDFPIVLGRVCRYMNVDQEKAMTFIRSLKT